MGDIIDFHEGKRASNGNGHIPVVIENVLSYLDDPAKAMSKEYKGSMEHIMLTNGKVGVSEYSRLDSLRSFYRTEECLGSR